MTHDVYICYDEKDGEVCDAVCNVLEENGISPWVKSRHFSSDDSVDRITNAISDSECFILILSKDSKAANFAIIETDIAFSRNVPIIAFNIDDSKVEGNLEFIFESQTMIHYDSDSKRQLRNLVSETSKVIGKDSDKIKIDYKSVGELEKVNPKRKENIIKKCIKIAIPIAIVLVLVYFFVLVPTGQHTTDDGVFSMNMTGVDVSGNTYTVRGESYNLPSDSARYFMNIRFFDENNNMVYEVNSTADEFKSGIMWQGDLPTDNITRVDFRLNDIDNNLLSQNSCEIS